MSSKLIKNGSNLTLVDNRIIAVVRIFESGEAQVEAPEMHPAILIKRLQSVIVDIQYASFQPADISRIAPANA